jgi:hypothetical protein
MGCQNCDVLGSRIDEYSEITKSLFLAWKDANPGEIYIAPKELFSWAKEEIEKHKIKASIYGAAIKGEQIRTEETLDEYDRLEMSNWALAEQAKHLLEETDHLNKVIYIYQSDIKDLLQYVPSGVDRCNFCDRFHLKTGACPE